jgi:sugar phosphate permease
LWAAGVARAGSGQSGGETVTGPERRAGARASDGEEERIAWLVAPGLAMIAVTYGLARFAYGLFLPEMRESLGLSESVLGLIGAGSYAGYCLAVIGALVCTSRAGPRFMAIAAGTVAVVGMAAVAGAPAAWVLALGVLVAGSSSGLASPPMGEAVAASVPEGL